MSVYVKVKSGDAVIQEMLVQDLDVVKSWLDRHRGEYDYFEVKYCKIADMRQGREPGKGVITNG